MVSILANIRISNPERLEHFKDSFLSCENISDDWLVNIRGDLREDALKFLRKKLSMRMKEFSLLDDQRGWLINAHDMIKKSKHKYILVWNEDHLNIAPESIYEKIVCEMEEFGVDYLSYSWWYKGASRVVFDKIADKIGLDKHKYIDCLVLTPEKWEKLKEAGYNYYLISLTAIFKKNFLLKLMSKDKNGPSLKLTFMVFKIIRILNKMGLRLNEQVTFQRVNRLLGYPLQRYSKVTPFNLEKDPSRSDILPIKLGLSKRELFACIDDDNGTLGYSLVSRGLYKKNTKRN